jgi:hypothetical protein
LEVKFAEHQDTLPKKWQTQTLKSAFLDTGGQVDAACLTMCRVDIPNRIIYVTGAMFWKLSEKDNVLFATIRNDIAKLHLIHKFDLMGCETNNYGRNEMESLRREYGIRMIGINTTGKVTDVKKIRSGLSMDKEEIVKFTNSWRQNPQVDPLNNMKLGQIKFLKKKTPDLIQLVNELDNFVRKDTEGIGATGRPKFGAEGSGHDDGPMSMLGNFHIIKTRIFKIYTGVGKVGSVPNKEHRVTPKMKLPGGGAVGTVKHDEVEQQMLQG